MKSIQMNFFILFLVSLSQCVPGEPSDELVAKYNDMKVTFLARLNNFNQVLRSALEPAMQSPEVQQIQGFFGSMDQRRVDASLNFLGYVSTHLFYFF